MGTQISINMITGNSEVTDGDRERAETAALKVLAAAGVTVEAAFLAYQNQWAEYDDDAPMHGDALAWIAAGAAANAALTEGWARPEAALCSISA